MPGQETNSQLVYSLWQAAKRSFERAEVTQVQLGKAADALKVNAQHLPELIARRLEEQLPHAASKAASMISANWTDANMHADRAAKAYQEAAQNARKIIYSGAFFVLGLFVLAMLVMAFWLRPKFETLAQLRVQEEQLQARIELLTKQGGRANLSRCEDSKGRVRLCIKVDESAHLKGKSIRVIDGY
jgi:hypothetical protein